MRRKINLVAVGIFSALFCRTASAEITATQGYPSTLTLKWDEQDDADGYRICRREEGSDWCILSDITQAQEYTDITAEQGISYTYSVRPFRLEDERRVQWMSDEIIEDVCILPPAPENIVVRPDEESGSVSVSWDVGKDSGGSSLLYAVSYFEVYSKKAEDISWKFLAGTDTLSNKKSTQIVVDVAGADLYTVRSVYQNRNGELTYSSYDEIGTEGAEPLAATARIYNSEANGTQGNRIFWACFGDDNTDGLEILRKKDGDAEYEVIQTITDKADIRMGDYTDQDVQTTNSYRYSVRAFKRMSKEKVYGWFEEEGVKITVLPNVPSMPSASYLETETPCIQIGWDQGGNTPDSCDGYRIYRRASNKTEWKLLGTNTGVGNTIFKDASLESTFYEYTITAYKENAEGELTESEKSIIVQGEVKK